MSYSTPWLEFWLESCLVTVCCSYWFWHRRALQNHLPCSVSGNWEFLKLLNQSLGEGVRTEKRPNKWLWVISSESVKYCFTKLGFHAFRSFVWKLNFSMLEVTTISNSGPFHYYWLVFETRTCSLGCPETCNISASASQLLELYACAIALGKIQAGVLRVVLHFCGRKKKDCFLVMMKTNSVSRGPCLKVHVSSSFWIPEGILSKVHKIKMRWDL